MWAFRRICRSRIHGYFALHPLTLKAREYLICTFLPSVDALRPFVLVLFALVEASCWRFITGGYGGEVPEEGTDYYHAYYEGVAMSNGRTKFKRLEING